MTNKIPINILRYEKAKQTFSTTDSILSKHGIWSNTTFDELGKDHHQMIEEYSIVNPTTNREMLFRLSTQNKFQFNQDECHESGLYYEGKKLILSVFMSDSNIKLIVFNE